MIILLFSVALSFVNACLPKFLNKISPCFVKKEDSKWYKDEREQIMAMLKTLSVRNDFPKYARLMRRLNKISEDKKSSDEAYQNSQRQIFMKLTYIAQGIMTLISLVMFWLYRFHPVIRLPHEWLYPFQYVLSWPIQTGGVISYPVWFIICNAVSKLLVGSFQE